MRTVRGSRLAGAIGDRAVVSCHHHQAVDEVAPTLRATAFAADGLVEAIEGPRDGPFVAGVQWHPELDGGGTRLLAALVVAAVARRDANSGGGGRCNTPDL
ncbi:hypothetical protein GCM10027062_35220 [Nocardioides hungaricus]